MEEILLNEQLLHEFELNSTKETFTKYVMSELLSPIEDFRNATELICKYFFEYSALSLTIIGAHLYTEWPEAENGKCLLDILNTMYQCLQPSEQAIVSYLNALRIRKTDSDYLHNKEYRSHLEESISYDTPFVYNKYWYSQIVSKFKARKYLSDARANVQHVMTENELMNIPIEYFIDPQNYINEHILGIELSGPNYQWMFQKSDCF